MAIRWIIDGDSHTAETYNRPLRDFIAERDGTMVPSGRKITVRNGITGGGNLGSDIHINGQQATTTQVGVTRYATEVETLSTGATQYAISPKSLRKISNGVGSGAQRWIQYGTSQRESGRDYINDTTLPIMININPTGARGNNASQLYVDGVRIAFSNVSNAYTADGVMTAIVPVGSSYRFVTSGRISTWSELR